MLKKDLFSFLEEKYQKYHSSEFIDSDPIQIPHFFSKKEDIEISGFLAATISWGNRKSIIKNANSLMERMDHAPHDFIINHTQSDLTRLEGFVHRTFNYDDILGFVNSLQRIYTLHNGLEPLFKPLDGENNLKHAISRFREVFFTSDHLTRTEKHVSNPYKNSACKRINMFLRWMVRTHSAGVDFGIWKNISSAHLSCPLDVHSGNVGRKLGLLNRKQNDWKAVEELDSSLRSLDPKDPVKYDFALFGLGVFEKF